MFNSKIVVTGGSGFIGGHLMRRLLKDPSNQVFNIDKLGYASDLFSLKIFKEKNNYFHINLDLKEKKKLLKIIKTISPGIIFHLAAESHVDNSILDPSEFIQSNIVGTFNLLEAFRSNWESMPKMRKLNSRFIHISTDEVFGSIEDNNKFNELSRYDPRSPYSASKASSDLLVKAWHNTYGIPIIISNCSNNYGPFQFPEKLIPKTIINCINQKNIPLYGNGENIRDWLYVEDHIDALLLLANKGNVGESYCVGGYGEIKNIEIVENICSLMDEIAPVNIKYNSLIKFVQDRPGHDKRYSIDSNKILKELGWEPKFTLINGLQKTINWYLNNNKWYE